MILTENITHKQALGWIKRHFDQEDPVNIPMIKTWASAKKVTQTLLFVFLCSEPRKGLHSAMSFLLDGTVFLWGGYRLDDNTDGDQTKLWELKMGASPPVWERIDDISNHHHGGIHLELTWLLKRVHHISLSKIFVERTFKPLNTHGTRSPLMINFPAAIKYADLFVYCLSRIRLYQQYCTL